MPTWPQAIVRKGSWRSGSTPWMSSWLDNSLTKAGFRRSRVCLSNRPLHNSRTHAGSMPGVCGRPSGRAGRLLHTDRTCHVRLVPGTYEFRRTQPEEIEGTPFWKSVSDGGMRVFCMDIPFALPLDDVAGIQLIDWGSHDRNVEFQALPTNLQSAIEPHPIYPRCNTYAREGRWSELRNGLLEDQKREPALLSPRQKRTTSISSPLSTGKATAPGTSSGHFTTRRTRIMMRTCGKISAMP